MDTKIYSTRYEPGMKREEKHVYIERDVTMYPIVHPPTDMSQCTPTCLSIKRETEMYYINLPTGTPACPLSMMRVSLL